MLYKPAARLRGARTAAGLPAHHFPQPPEGKIVQLAPLTVQAREPTGAGCSLALGSDAPFLLHEALIAGMIRATNTPMMAITTRGSNQGKT